MKQSMGFSNASSSKQRNARQWRLRDMITVAFFGAVLLFCVSVFAATGRRMFAHSPDSVSQLRAKLVEYVEFGKQTVAIDACPTEMIDHMPCEDPRINSLLSREMNFYRERHCPTPEEMPLCLIPPPKGYKVSVQWPESLHKVASFGGYMLAESILTLSFAPRDSHKAQIQFALERGIPAFIAMLGTRRLPFPAFSFDLMHCSRCLIPFTAYNATYFIEVDRLLRPGGYLVISGPPVRWSKQDKEWANLQEVAKSLCYELVVVDGNTAIWKKPDFASCLSDQNENGIYLCEESADPSFAWYYTLKKCVSRASSSMGVSLAKAPKWPNRLTTPPSRTNVIENGVNRFEEEDQIWQTRVAYYKNSLNVKLGSPSIRNIMDMNAFFGSFAASIISDPVWVMNVVPAHKPSTLGVIYDRGLIGVYHDWCEPFSTYPRTYDLIHVDSIESLIVDPDSRKSRCTIIDLMFEIDRMLRPKGTVIIRDSPEVINKIDRICRVIRWKTSIHDKEPESHGREKILVATKTMWKL